jgi:hypothetical protein
VLTPGRVSRLAVGSVGSADRIALAGAEHTRELRVMKLRPPHRFSNGGAGLATGVPPMIRTVRAAGSIGHTRNRVWPCVGARRRAGYAIDCGPDGQAERCSDKHAAEHAAIVARSRVSVKRVAASGPSSTVFDAVAATFEACWTSRRVELSSRCSFFLSLSLM